MKDVLLERRPDLYDTVNNGTSNGNTGPTHIYSFLELPGKTFRHDLLGCFRCGSGLFTDSIKPELIDSARHDSIQPQVLPNSSADPANRKFYAGDRLFEPACLNSLTRRCE